MKISFPSLIFFLSIYSPYTSILIFLDKVVTSILIQKLAIQLKFDNAISCITTILSYVLIVKLHNVRIFPIA